MADKHRGGGEGFSAGSRTDRPHHPDGWRVDDDRESTDSGYSQAEADRYAADRAAPAGDSEK